MDKQQTSVKPFRDLPKKVQLWLQQEQNRKKAVVDQIAQDPGAKKALNKLKRYMPERELIICLSEKVESAGRAGEAELRKADKRAARAVLKKLEQARQIAWTFPSVPQHLPAFDKHLRISIAMAKGWTEVKSPKPFLNRRNRQQLRFIEDVRKRSGKPHYREVATLLCAAYSAQGIPEKQFPTENSLTQLHIRGTAK
jgi:hypothetical protein